MDPIVSRERIATQADEAAQVAARTKTPQPNPYPTGSEAAKCWRADYLRSLVKHSCPECEASA